MIPSQHRSSHPHLILRRCGGFSLLEVVVSMVLIAVLIVPTLNVFGMITASYAVNSRRATADSLAQDLMAEIVQSDYHDANAANRTFGPESAETTRADFNDIDDYHALIEQPPVNRDGTTIDGTAKYTRAVTVEFVDPADPTQIEADDTGLKRITVSVDAPGVTTSVSLSALRAVNGVYEVLPPPDTGVTQRVELELGIGLQPGLKTGMNIMNQRGEAAP